MRMLLLHASRFGYKVTGKAIENPEEDVDKSGDFGEVLVSFVTVERNDGMNLEAVINNAVSSIAEVAERVNVKRIVIYPYAHLSSELASPSVAMRLIRMLSERLKEEGFEVWRSPFGWYKRFYVEVKGHPLSEHFRVITGEAAVGRKEEPKAEVPGKIVVVDLDGSEYEVTPESLEYLDVLRENPTLLEYLKAEFGIKGEGKTPPHIDLMRRLELVDYEPASDVGHMRFYPKGALVKEVFEDFAKEKAIVELNAMTIETPIMYKTSEPDIAEQVARFRERDYRFFVDDTEFVLRFAADFGLFRMMRDATVSYKDLPLRIFELSKSFRLEQSGEVVGLRRLRAFTMPDIHSFCADLEQAMEEYGELLAYYRDIANATGIEYAVGIRVVEEFYRKHFKWIRELVRIAGKPTFVELLPARKHYWVIKHEIQFVDSVGSTAQLSTVQLDVEDAERYGLTYVDRDGSRKYYTIVHSSVGSVERWIYALLEEAAKMMKRGDAPMLPVWLSPIQVRVIPVSPENLKYAQEVFEEIRNSGFRVDLDDREESLGARIRDAEREWVPYIVVVGRKERESRTISVRIRRERKNIAMKTEELIQRLENECRGYPKKPLNLPPFLSRRPKMRG